MLKKATNILELKFMILQFTAHFEIDKWYLLNSKKCPNDYYVKKNLLAGKECSLANCQ